MKYDLEDRTLKFSRNLVDLCKKMPKNVITLPLINQVIRSGTSVGANYREANGASSKKDFMNKIFICKKEIKETYYWLELLIQADNSLTNDINTLNKEAQELTLIFSSIAANAK